MKNTFWTHTSWYIMLALTSAAALFFIYRKASQRAKTFAFYFAVLGFTYSLEVLLLLVFNAYTYYPMIFPEDTFFDAVLGNIFSQVSVSSSAVLICIYNLSIWWLAGFSFAYFLIDVLFIKLGIYEHNWFQSIFTLIGFFIYGLVVKHWYKLLSRRYLRLLFYLTLFLSSWSVSANLAGTMEKIAGLRYFQSFLYQNDPSRSHTATALIYAPLLIIIMILVSKWRAAIWKKAIVLTLLFSCQMVLLMSGIIVIKAGWGVVVLLLDLIIYYGCTIIMYKSLIRPLNKKHLLDE